MGSIIYKALIRTALAIAIIWVFSYYMNFQFRWIAGAAFFFLVVVYPFVNQLKKFQSENKEILTDTICAQCRHFDETAALCMKYDEHVRKDFIPCGGVHWEPL